MKVNLLFQCLSKEKYYMVQHFTKANNLTLIDNGLPLHTIYDPVVQISNRAHNI